jgi:drug/metabolite transporter (DMT)-like permease
VLARQPDHLKGAAYGLAAVSIWAGWSVVTRLAVTTGLDAWDIPALRFGVAGVLLLPVLIRRGLALDRLGWGGLAGLIVGTGAPYALVVAFGLRFAPAYDAGALNPGCMPLFVALIGATVLGEMPSTRRKAGLSLILFGALVVIGAHGGAWNMPRLFGDALFLAASFLTACYTAIMRRASLAPIHVAALVSTGSLIVYAPAYLVLHGFHLGAVPLAGLAFQAIFQGIVVTIISLVLYGRAVLILGASGGAAFGALVPALSAVLAIPLGWIAIFLISVGVYLGGAGPVPRP